MSVIEGYEPFAGQHCETTTTGNLLKAAGMELSEPMLFGLGEGLAFGVFATKSMAAPFIGGRARPERITQNLARHLAFDLAYRETRSKPRAWANIAEFVDAGQPVAVKLNARFLDYFTSNVDFAAHYVAVYGYDDETVFVVDTNQQGGPTATRRDTFEEGRLWKGPMSSNAMTWTVDAVRADVDWPTVLRPAISANARTYLNPPIANFGASGIRKTAKLIRTWHAAYAAEDLAQLGAVMERGGTGGGLFRVMYSTFLDEAAALLSDDRLREFAVRFADAARVWTEVAAHLEGCAGDPAADATHLDAASELLLRLADMEEGAMTGLLRATA